LEKRGLTLSSDDVSTATSMPGAGVGAGIGLAVLSQDDSLLDTLEEVVTSDHAITMCTAESELAEAVISGRCGVALIDAETVPGSIAELTGRLRQQFLDLVLVVAGGTEHQGQLAAQITSGDVYRFLHKPVSAQRVRLFVEAALRRHDEEHASSRRLGGPGGVGAGPGAAGAGAGGSAARGFAPSDPPARGKAPLPVAALAAVGALVLAGGVWFATRDSTPAPSAGAAAPVAGAAGTGAPAARENPLDAPTQALLEQADKAYARGELVGPAGRSAADLYRQVLQKVPGQPQATAGLDKVVNALLGLAEKAILEGKLDDAARNIESAKALQPDNVRIAFLSTQLGKERERALLTRARQAAASGDLGRALAVLDSSGEGNGANAGLVAEARRSLEAQQVNSRVRELLRLANERLRSGALTEPASDNARFYLESARALAPREPGLARLSDQITARAMSEARAAVARGDTAAANRWIRSAGDLGVPAAELEPLRNQLNSAQTNTRAAEVGRLAALVSQRIGQGRLLEPANDSARGYFDALVAAEPNGPTVASLRAPLGRAMLGQAREAIGRGDFAAAQRWIGEAEQVGSPAAEVAPVNADLVAARDRLQQRNQVVGAGGLKRIRTVEPTYPREAKAQNVTGWVDLEFTVAPDGSVADIKVNGSQPAAVFDVAAVEAISKWRFEPVRRDGAAIEQRARLRMRFQIE
jgi:TonB family protein